MIQEGRQATPSQSRAKLFISLMLKFGTLKRGSLIAKMNSSSQTFSREYIDYLDQYPTVKYNKQTREFTYEP